MTLNAKIGGFMDVWRFRPGQVYIIHNAAPHAPMADVYYGRDGPSPNDMRFSKL